MRPASPSSPPPARSHTPRAFTVFAAAFVAGAAAAVGVNSVLDVRLSQAKPRVESEPIFVALRSLPQGVPVTVWDVALRDWPRAMVPTSALRASDSFSGLVLKHPLREGQPLLSIQLVEADAATSSVPVSVTTISAPAAVVGRVPEYDLWSPAAPVAPATSPSLATPPSPATATTQSTITTPTTIEAPQTATVASAAQQQPQFQPAPQPQPDVPAARAAEPSAAAADATVASAVAQPAASPTTSPSTAAVTTDSTAATAPSLPTQPVIEAAPRDPAEDVAATAAPVASAPTPVPAADAFTDEIFTDEMLEAMAATGTPAAEGLVTPPADAAVTAADAVAAGPNQGGSPRVTAEDASDPESPIATGGDASLADGAVAMQPAATPTLADPPLAAIDGQQADDAPAAAPASVMRQSTADAPMAAAPSRPRVARYLVVPESIALQADASFATPPARPAGDAVQPLPPAGSQQPVKQPVQQRASQPRRGTSAATTNAPQRSSAPQAAAQQQQRRGGMFPNIAAGIGTLDTELGRVRREWSGQNQSQGPNQVQGQQVQGQQPANRRPRPQY